MAGNSFTDKAKERILVAFYKHFILGMFTNTRESVSQNPALYEMYSPSDNVAESDAPTILKCMPPSLVHSYWSIALPTVYFNIFGLLEVQGCIVSTLLESLRKVEASTHEWGFFSLF